MRGRGFTLIELLLSLVIAAMLMVGIFHLLPAIRSDGSTSPSDPHTENARAITSIIQRDLQHARIVAVEPDQVVLTGYSSIDAASQSWSHRPASIQYLLQDLGGRSWLARRQVALDDPGAIATVELLCPDVISLMASATPPAAVDNSLTTAVPKPPVRLRGVPPVLYVTLKWAGEAADLTLVIVSGN